MRQRKWLCIRPGSAGYFTKGKTYKEGEHGLIDDNGYAWSLGGGEFNQVIGYLFKELTFQIYVEQCERLVDSGLPESKGI